MAYAAQVLAALACEEPAQKCRLVAAIAPPSGAPAEAQPSAAELVSIPGRPQRPQLVHPRTVAHRGLGSAAGRAALIHAVAHIEFNAINLALDAAFRFRGMPLDFYADWLSVAQDEARHFSMLSARLAQLGHAYGDFPAHNGLWEAAEKTAHDVLERMALVPRVLEARGLDVTPGMILRLREVGDTETVAVLEVILDEEVRHVTIGTRWYRYLCDQRGLDSDSTFESLLQAHGARIRPPLNWAARMQAGFHAAELPVELRPA